MMMKGSLGLNVELLDLTLEIEFGVVLSYFTHSKPLSKLEDVKNEQFEEKDNYRDYSTNPQTLVTTLPSYKLKYKY